MKLHSADSFYFSLFKDETGSVGGRWRMVFRERTPWEPLRLAHFDGSELMLCSLYAILFCSNKR